MSSEARGDARRTVLIVEDSAMLASVLRDLVDGFDGFRVVGTARDGEEGLRLVHALAPDIVTLDIEMPGLDGLAVLGYIMSEAPRPVVMVSAATTRGAVDLTIRALELGAVDFVRKPAGATREAWQASARQLEGALLAAAQMNVGGVSVLARPRLRTPAPLPRMARRATAAIAIASSTGGPRALAEIIPGFSPDVDAALLIAQHMPPGFTTGLARRLDQLSALPVHEAVHGESIESGRAYLAPGGRHMTVTATAAGHAIVLSDGPLVHGVRPAADPLFVSVAERFRERSVGVVLTGMGRDGTTGLQAIRGAGGGAVVQDRASSVIYGMPFQALRDAGADREVALRDVAGAVTDLVRAFPAMRAVAS
jgi:two-component system chemotaxis response regulator CheB